MSTPISLVDGRLSDYNIQSGQSLEEGLQVTAECLQGEHAALEALPDSFAGQNTTSVGKIAREADSGANSAFRARLLSHGKVPACDSSFRAQWEQYFHHRIDLDKFITMDLIPSASKSSQP